MAQAALSLAIGVFIVGGLITWRDVPHRKHVTRAIAVAGVILVWGAVLGSVIEMSSSDSVSFSQATIIMAAIASGIAIYAWRVEVSPSIFLGGGLLLAYAALSESREVSPSFSALIILLTASMTLPTLDSAVHTPRHSVRRFESIIVIWIGLSLMLVIHVATNLYQRGMWFDTTTGAAWLMSAWLASSSSLLLKPGLVRTISTVIAALLVIFLAFNTL